MTVMAEAERVRADEGVPATGPRILAMLTEGGRAVVTVRSLQTGRHVTVRFVAKRRKDGGRGWVSRATNAGRVGIDDADAVFVDDPSLPFEEARVGTLWVADGEFRPAPSADPAWVWAAEKVLAFAYGRYELAEVAAVFLADECARCGKPLTDPTSVERGVGPECYGRGTSSRLAERLPGLGEER